MSVGLGAARETSRRSSCQNNQKQLGIALTQFVSSSGGKLPFHNPGDASLPSSDRPARVGPWFQLAPFLELDAFKPAVLFNGAGMSGHDVSQLPGVFRCPSDTICSFAHVDRRVTLARCGKGHGYPGGVNLCRANGSVAFISNQIDGQIWTAMATIAGDD